MSISTKAGITLAAFLCCHLVVAGQFAETIRTDRPGQAIVPYAVGKGVLQLQSGAVRGWAKTPSVNYKYWELSANTTLRYGITRRFELNTSWEYRQNKVSFGRQEASGQGLSPFNIGMRYNIMAAKNKRPAVGIQLSLNVPWQSPDYNEESVTSLFLLTAAERLTEKLTLTLVGGGDYNAYYDKLKGIYIINLAYQAMPQLSVFAEGYGNVQGKMWEHRWDAGVAFLVNRNLQLDAYGGAGSNNGVTDYFASIGVSYRIAPGNSRQQTEKK